MPYFFQLLLVGVLTLLERIITRNTLVLELLIVTLPRWRIGERRASGPE